METKTGTASEKNIAAEMKQETKQQAREIKDEAVGTGRRLGERGKDSLAQIGIDIAEAMNSAAGELENKERKVSAEYIRSAAQKVQQFSDGLRDRGVDDIARQAMSYGKRQPVLLLGGAVVAGFALTRLLRSTNGSRHHADKEYDDMHPAASRSTSPPGTRATSPYESGRAAEPAATAPRPGAPAAKEPVASVKYASAASSSKPRKPDIGSNFGPKAGTS